MSVERPCAFCATLCYSLLRAAWLTPGHLLGTDVPYTQLPNQLSLCVEGFGIMQASSEFRWAAAHPRDSLCV